ncbi:hypothetical protein GQ457_05G031800 [Hibiscus cannabinus]
MNMLHVSLTHWIQALALLVLRVSCRDLAKELLDAHNAARKGVGVPPMSWDNMLADFALNYSQGQINNDFSATDAVRLWVAQKKYYNLESGVCARGRICRHYTQVIWINSTQLGCAKVGCSNNSGTLIACYYYPAGNIPGKRPTEGIESLVRTPPVAPVSPIASSSFTTQQVTSTVRISWGEGGFGSVYRGFLRDLGTYIAVKRVSKASKQGIREYASEVTIISRLRHKNLVKLTGWCHDRGELLLVDHSEGLKTTVLAGTVGYIAPECVSSGKASKESDVYSFGVVTLEIACGRRSIEPKFQDSHEAVLVPWVWESYGNGKALDVADKKMGTGFDPKQMECLVIVGLWCAHPSHDQRPSIRQVIQALHFEAPLPDLPSTMHVPS